MPKIRSKSAAHYLCEEEEGGRGDTGDKIPKALTLERQEAQDGHVPPQT